MSCDVAIIGLGYVGLPLAQEATKAGLKVCGLDISTRILTGLAEGRSHVDDLSDADIAEMLAAGFTASDDFTQIKDAKTVVICVPTPLSDSGGPDLGPVMSAADAIGRNLSKGTLVVLESTTYPGTTDEELGPRLKELSGLTPGEDFHLAFSPERIDPGNQKFGPKNTPKVVGGITPACTEAAATFYGQFVDTVVRTRGTREAEMAKLLENTYRHINIALVNEMAKFCHDLDIDLWDAINAASTKPFGFQAFRPGPGVGGHCIPIDPNYLSYNVRSRLGYPFRFVELAQEINHTMPAYVEQRIQDLLNEDGKAIRGSKVLLLGVTYKPDIADTRETPALPLAKLLIKDGADLRIHDPLVTHWKVDGNELTSVDDLMAAVADADVCVLLQHHKDYDLSTITGPARRFLDTRGVTERADNVERL